MTDNLTPEKRFLSWPIYIFLGLGLLAMVLGVLPAGLIGVACLLLPLALVLEPLGEPAAAEVKSEALDAPIEKVISNNDQTK